MKCKGNLWDGMISFENLLRAAHAAARGKRFKPGVARFFFHLEPQLLRLHEELVAQTYRPGPYRTFTITETGLRPGVVGQPAIVSHDWASMNLERWATLALATVSVSLEPTDNRAWAAKMQSPSNASGPAVGNPALRAAAHSSAARSMMSVVMGA